MNSFAKQRWEMVEHQIAARGIRAPGVLDAMREVPRERFVQAELIDSAYNDSALAIEEEQTISQPYIVALMAESLNLADGDRVLEVGAGSGYAAAVLSRIAGEVFAIERFPLLAQMAAQRARDLGYENIHVRCGDGTLGWSEQAPFDAISVAAGGAEVPADLLDQLEIGGRLVIPIGADARHQELLLFERRSENDFEHRSLGKVRFVPLVAGGA